MSTQALQTTQSTAQYTPHPHAEAIAQIRADIRQHLAIARKIRQDQQGTSGPTRDAYNNDLRHIGNGTGSCFSSTPKDHPASPARYLYLVLAFLRGRALDSVEPFRPTYREEDRWCEPFLRRTNPIDPFKLTKAIGQYLPESQCVDLTGQACKGYNGRIDPNSPLGVFLQSGLNYGGRGKVDEQVQTMEATP